jgi:[acyl-carrier-protein] S-malonyltransferase
MGRPWVDHPSWELVADASDVAGRDLARLLLDADADELRETGNAQPATFTLSLVILDAVERLGIEPTACAGHSLGEYTALVAAGALSFEEGVGIVTERGDAMQAAAEETTGVTWSILGLDDEAVDVACRRADGEVWVASYNSADEHVVAGSLSSVEAAAAIARRSGARKVLPTGAGGAFHTPFMASARDRLRKALHQSTFRDPEVPVVANVDALPHRGAEEWESLLSAQLCSPVRWRQGVLRLAGLGGDDPADHHDGERLFVELGPGDGLTGLVRRIAPAATALPVCAPADLDLLVEAIAGHTALHAWAAGHHGEHLYVSERVVISPCAGVFEPPASPGKAGPDPASDPAGREGELIEVGTLLGRVGREEVRSPFRGWLMGMLAVPGERVQPGQPVAWLRAG